MARLKENVLYSLDTSINSINPDGSLSTVEVIADFIRREVKRRGDRIYVKEAENERDSVNVIRQRMLSEFLPFSSRVANALLENGLTKGENVQICMEDNTDYFMVCLGVWMAGGVLALSDPSRTPPIALLDETKSRFIFCTADLVEELMEVVNKAKHKVLKVILVNSVHESKEVIPLEEFIKGQKDTMPNAHKEIKMGDMAAIFCTSGSTGKPKGILWNHRAILNCFDNKFYATEKEDTTFLSTATSHHVYGFLVHLVNVVMHGVTYVFFNWPKYEIPAKYIFAACHKYKPTVIATEVNYGNLLANAEMPPFLLDSVERIEPIGGPLCEEVIEKLVAKFPKTKVLNGYGMTEIGGVCMSYTYTNLGVLTRGVIVKIADPETGEILGPNKVGEMLIKSETMMSGYLFAENEVVQEAFTKDGFVKTGDLGYYDEKGQLYYKDRLKAMVRYMDFDIYPNLIEAIIMEFPGVADAGVFGKKDEQLNELVTALVEKIPGEQVDADALTKFVNDRLEWYEHIRGGVYFVDKIPRNRAGKIVRMQLPGLLTTAITQE